MQYSVYFYFKLSSVNKRLKISIILFLSFFTAYSQTQTMSSSCGSACAFSILTMITWQVYTLSIGNGGATAGGTFTALSSTILLGEVFKRQFSSP